MDIDPSAHDLNLAHERETIVEAAAKIAAVLAQAHGEERSGLVEAVDDTLHDAGVVVIDTGSGDEAERRGKYHDITRSQMIQIITDREERRRRKLAGLPVLRRPQL